MEEPSDEWALVKRPSGRFHPAHVALIVSLALVTIALLAPVVMMVWAALVLGVVALAGTLLVTTGGLDPRTFGVSMGIGLAIGALVLLAAWNGWARSRRDGLRDGSPVERAPVWSAAGALTLAVVATVAMAAPRSPYFPAPLATMFVIAATAFATVVTFALALRLLRWISVGLYRWGHDGGYRAGLLTATAMLLAAGSAWAHYTGLSQRPWHALHDELALAQVAPPTGLADAGAKALCLAAAETGAAAPYDRRAAPGCDFLPGPHVGGAHDLDRDGEDDCVEAIFRDAYADTRAIIRRQVATDAEADEAMAEAITWTCVRDEAPRDAIASFVLGAWDHAQRLADGHPRLRCDEPIAPARHACSPADAAAVRHDEGDRRRAIARCGLDARARTILDRRFAGASYQAIGAELGLGERQARDLLARALDELRAAVRTVDPICLAR